MSKFNYFLLAFDLAMIGLPFLLMKLEVQLLAQFAAGFAITWFVLSLTNNKINFKRYKL